MYTIGYYKDLLATIHYLIYFVVFYYDDNINKYRDLLLVMLLIGFLIDFTFSVSPSSYKLPFGKNKPTYIIISALFANTLFSVYYLQQNHH